MVIYSKSNCFAFRPVKNDLSNAIKDITVLANAIQFEVSKFNILI